MKRFQFAVGLVFVVGMMIAPVSRAAYSESVRQALQKAVSEAGQSLADASLPEGQTVSVLSVRGDQEGYVEGLLKNAVTSADIPYVEGGQDPVWDAILREVEWDERKEDMLDPATLSKFGKLKSTQLLLYGTVREVTETPQRVYVELELHLSSIETKQHVWGGIFAHRFYLPDTVQGLMELDEAVRETLKEAVADAGATVTASPKLGDVSTVAVVPFAGDIDGYVEQLAVDMLSNTELTPRELDFSTLAEARQAMRDTPDRADAILVGAVRDLSRELVEELPQKTTYEVRAEVQLSIQNAANGDVLWSQTVSAKTEDVEETSIEETAWSLLKDNPMWTVYALGGLVALIIIVAFLRSTRRVR